MRATEEIREMEVRRESEEEVEVDLREGRRVSESKEGKRVEEEEVVGIKVAARSELSCSVLVTKRELRRESRRTDGSNCTFPYCSPRMTK